MRIFNFSRKNKLDNPAREYEESSKIRIVPIGQNLPNRESENVHRLLRQIRTLLSLLLSVVLIYTLLSAYWFFSQDRVSDLYFPKKVNDQPKKAESTSINVSAGRFFADKSDDGVRYEAVVTSTSNVHLFFADDHNRPLGDFRALRDWLALNKQKLMFATNAGMYGRDFQPLGLHVEDGKLIKKLNLSREEKLSNGKPMSGNFFVFPNGVFSIKNEEASISESTALKDIVDWGDTKLATQSGPILLTNNKINPEFDQASPNRKIRNGVGIINKHSIVFIITKDPVTFYDLAVIFKNRFDCKDALYLDGAISDMYVNEVDRNNLENDLFAGMFAISIPDEVNSE